MDDKHDTDRGLLGGPSGVSNPEAVKPSGPPSPEEPAERGTGRMEDSVAKPALVERTGEQPYLPPGREPGERGGPGLRREGEAGPAIRSEGEVAGQPWKDEGN